MTVAYGTWAVALADAKPSDTTENMVTYLLKTQRSEGHWIGQSCRPPLEESYFTCTTLTVRSLRAFAAESQREQVAAAIAKATIWLATVAREVPGRQDRANCGDCFDRRSAERLRSARDAVLAAQRSDGGWGQLEEMDSDAYATGQTMYILHATGFDPADAIMQRGSPLLLKTQRNDGYWLVTSRLAAHPAVL